LWIRFIWGRQGPAAHWQGLNRCQARVEDLLAHAPNSPRSKSSRRYRQVSVLIVGRSPKLAWRQLIAIRPQVRAAHAAATALAWAAGLATGGHRFASSRRPESEAIQAAAPGRILDAATASGGCRPWISSWLGSSERKHRLGHRRLAACLAPEPPYRWRGRGTALLWRGFITHVAEAPLLLQGRRDSSREQ